MVPMASPLRPRPHRRARAQLCLGLAPLVAVGMAVLVVLGLRLAEARAPLAEAKGTALAHVVEAGQPPDGRGVLVAFTDNAGRSRSGRLVLAEPVAVAPGADVAVRYDPAAAANGFPTVHADGDAASRTVQDLAAGMTVVAGALVLATGLTGVVVLTRRRLQRRAAVTATATRLVVRRGLLVRSWLELQTAEGLRWVPVFWAPELAGLLPDDRIELRGDPATDRLVLPVVSGAEIWPSGRVRDRAPRGEQRAPRAEPAMPSIGMARQLRVDVVVTAAAPLLGLLWAYVDGSGAGGFAAGTALTAVVLFWTLQLLGSDPEATARS